MARRDFLMGGMGCEERGTSTAALTCGTAHVGACTGTTTGGTGAGILTGACVGTLVFLASSCGDLSLLRRCITEYGTNDKGASIRVGGAS